MKTSIFIHIVIANILAFVLVWSSGFNYDERGDKASFAAGLHVILTFFAYLLGCIRKPK